MECSFKYRIVEGSSWSSKKDKSKRLPKRLRRVTKRVNKYHLSHSNYRKYLTKRLGLFYGWNEGIRIERSEIRVLLFEFFVKQKWLG